MRPESVGVKSQPGPSALSKMDVQGDLIIAVFFGLPGLEVTAVNQVDVDPREPELKARMNADSLHAGSIKGPCSNQSAQPLSTAKPTEESPFCCRLPLVKRCRLTSTH